ncbi:MAG: hypothetical protein IJ822_07340 [Pyramidobacter sp.]|nr:hypothetical protein [Pyramidobacter sp.]
MSEKAEKFLALQDEIEAVAFCGALGAIIAQLEIICEILDSCPSGDLLSELSETKGNLALVVIDLKKSHHLMMEMLTRNMKERAQPSETK